MKTNQDFKNAALAALKGNWAPAVLVAVIYIAIVGVAMFISNIPTIFPAASSAVLVFAGVSMLFGIFVRLPFEVGCRYTYLRLYQVGESRLPGVAVETSVGRYWMNLWCYFLVTLKIVLWSFLLFIPGVIKALEYSMTPYILAENPEIGAREAIHRSSAMMKGHRFDLFYLYLSFLGWFLLSFLTLGIGLLWLLPYYQTTEAAFYENLKEPSELLADIPALG